MRVGIIGGYEKAEVAYHKVAKAHGHEVEFHGGHATARGHLAIASLVDRCELVVIVTDVNSHASVLAARQLVRRSGREPIVVRRFGVKKLSEFFDELARTGTIPAVA